MITMNYPVLEALIFGRGLGKVWIIGIGCVCGVNRRMKTDETTNTHFLILSTIYCGALRPATGRGLDPCLSNWSKTKLKYLSNVYRLRVIQPSGRWMSIRNI